MNFFFRAFKHMYWRFKILYKITVPQFIFSIWIKREVHSGPFKGMKYINSSVGSVILPKLIGTYESELFPVWEELKNYKYDLFIDIGAAEGYYVVGLGKYIFNSKIPTVAFELTLKGQKLINNLSVINSYVNFIVNGECTIEKLYNLILGKSCFLLMDVEGAENSLLNTEIIDFSNCDLLIECHPEIHNNINLILRMRFSKTHSITEIRKSLKTLPVNLYLPKFLLQRKDYLLNEFRGEQTWLFLKRKV